MQDKTTSCAAVVLTYNRLHFLIDCIDAIKNQSRKPDFIIVIDNGSANDTVDWLNSQSGLRVVRIEKNVGPAAGIRKGLEEAYSTGCEWIWITDDDGRPDVTAMEKLLDTKPTVIAAKNSLVLDKEDKATLVFKVKNYKSLQDIHETLIPEVINPWNGTMFHKEIISKIGFPKSELFLWGEETEYFYRIKTSGFDLFTVRDSFHFHPMNAGFFYKSSWDVKTNWRAYFFIRNKYAVYKAKYSGNGFLAASYYGVFAIGFFFFILFHQKKQKWKKMKLTFWSLKDGVRENYRKSVDDVMLMLARL
jgi:rhamnopyranosyl-N-acetylglucosaminyl-diphospho-decaprenol beta-1,3/1,4-galactofuranosyltransferase